MATSASKDVSAGNLLTLSQRRRSRTSSLSRFYLCQISPYPLRVGADVALADARERAHIQPATAAGRSDAQANIILEAEPESCCRGFNAALRRIAGNNLPSHCAGCRQSVVKSLCRGNIQIQGSDIGIDIVLYAGDFLVICSAIDHGTNSQA